ncbi:MAG: aspartate/glutamate racemase family protein [Alphaproteobacteria bacterium]|nr:aspartate/glutamate racemase family protein [Alphaproteobacteria bacterium]MCY4319398.1 aspartate/glutamate racemase family protein [Alphaproteobacteria bacterium]
MTVAIGGKPIGGATLGILMLDARFPRVPGDMGNGDSWPFPVLYEIVRGATPERVVRHRAEGLDGAFLNAARRLVDRGATVLATVCGFLSLFQSELAAHAGVPVASSTLMQVPVLDLMLPPGKWAGVVTVSRESLSADHFTAVGARADTPVEGTEGGRELTRVLIGNEAQLDMAAAEADVTAAARRLTARCPEVGALVLECANMAPYAAAVRRATELPVHDIYSFISWAHSGFDI